MRWRLFSLVCLFSLFAQAQVSPYNGFLRKKLASDNSPSQTFDLLVQGEVKKLENLQQQNGFILKYSAGNIAAIHCSKNQLAELFRIGLIQRAELMPATKKPLNDTMVYKNRIKAVKMWTAPLPQAYNGEGILLGLIDTGVDFNHPDFKDAQGKTRILYLWDQVPTAGSTIPQPYNYGIEWTAAQINANLCTHNDMPYFGHGTGVCGIAAGNGLATGRFEGVASKSDVIVVALDFNKIGPTIADAVNYIVNKATQLGRHFVINASLGDYYGSHDATDLEAKLIENMVTNIPGRAMVAAVGNAGHVKYHTKTQLINNDTLFTWIKNPGPILNYWCYADLSQINNLQMSIGANRSDYSDLGNIGFKNYNYALNSIQSDTLKHNNNRIGIVESMASINAYGVYELSIEIKADSSNLFWRIENKGNGLQQAWNFDFVSTGLPSIAQFPKMSHYIMPDTISTMVSGFQCSNEIITVANYVNQRKFFDVNNNLVDTGEPADELAGSSSSGPTRDNRQKPDVSATGNNVITAMELGMQAFLLANAPQVVAQGSMHIQGGGSSAASPVVAGLAALYLQKNPLATNREIRDAIQHCAYSDAFTGNNLPHPQWGYGKLDGKATLLCNDDLVVGFTETHNKQVVLAFPNPFHNQVTLHFNPGVSGKLKIYNLMGDLVFEDELIGSTYELNADNFSIQNSGLYLLHILSGDKNHSFKLLKD